jgi:hypothetical protein
MLAWTRRGSPWPPGRLLPGASCNRDDHTKIVFAQLLARQLEHLLMVLTAESVKGRSVLPC